MAAQARARSRSEASASRETRSCSAWRARSRARPFSSFSRSRASASCCASRTPCRNFSWAVHCMPFLKRSVSCEAAWSSRAATSASLLWSSASRCASTTSSVEAGASGATGAGLLWAQAGGGSPSAAAGSMRQSRGAPAGGRGGVAAATAGHGRGPGWRQFLSRSGEGLARMMSSCVTIDFNDGFRGAPWAQRTPMFSSRVCSPSHRTASPQTSRRIRASTQWTLKNHV
mmetsp:Transcript_2044/g.6014  ORF Transcript_2044/g.6014 Transcript_2044/m.6014 type:complete len:229 (+) Transcript_2044:540-1226(+)